MDEFMLKEYESIAAAHFDCQAGIRQQFRFYLILIAVPVTVLGLAFNGRSPSEIAQVDLFELPSLFRYLFMAVGILGTIMLLSMIHTALDALLYARTVNGIRAFFSDRGSKIGIDLSPYLLMPTEKNKPTYFHPRGFFWLVVLMALMNATYIALPVFDLFGRQWCYMVGFGVLVFLVQIAVHWFSCWFRERKGVPV